MKLKFTKLIVFMLFLIFLSVNVLAHSASLTWTMNKPNYEVELYPCDNSDCSSVGSRMIFTTASGYTYYMYYTTPKYDAYHAAYFYKDGYRPIGYTLHSWGDPGYTWVTSFSDNFEKKDYCTSDIGTLSVSDSNPTVGDTISISTTVDSAFTVSDDASGTPKYYPASHADYFTSDIEVSVKVYDSTDTLVMTLPAQTKAIYQDGSASVSFDLDTSSLTDGEYDLKLSTDPTDSICDQGNKVIQTKTATIDVEADNTAPIISGIPDQTVDEDSGLHDDMIDLWDYASDAESPDADLIFTITSQTHSDIIDCEMDSNQYIDCTTQTDMSGSSVIAVEVEDSEGLTDSDTFTITVDPLNDAPVVSDIPGETITEGEDFTTFDLDDYVTDIDGDEIEWTVTGDVDLDVDIDTDNIVTITYDIGWTGSETLTFTAEDPDLETDSDDATFTVEEIPNEAPVMGNGDVYVFEDSGLSTIDLGDYASDAEDADDELIYTIVSESDTSIVDCEIDSGQYMDCTTQTDEYGDSEVTIEVEDTEGLTDTGVITIHVTAVNDAPVVSGIPSQTIEDGDDFTTFDLDDYVTDVDNSDDELEWSVTGDDDLDVVIDSDHVVTVTYLSGWTDSETLTFTAEDPDEETGSDDATFTVEDPNTAPEIEDLPNKILDENSGLNDDLIDLWDYAEDAEDDDDELEFTIIEQTNAGLVDCEIDDNRRIDCEVDDDETGYSYITVQVEDTGGLTDTDKFKIIVEEWDDDNDDDDDDDSINIYSIVHEDKVKAGDYMHINVYVTGDDDGAKTTVYFDELDIYETFSKLTSIHIQIPEDAEAGKYDFGISVKNKAGHKDTVHRQIEVTNDAVSDSDDSDDEPDDIIVTGATTSTQSKPSFYLQGLKGILIGLFFLLAILVVFLLFLRYKAKR